MALWDTFTWDDGTLWAAGPVDTTVTRTLLYNVLAPPIPPAPGVIGPVVDPVVYQFRARERDTLDVLLFLTQFRQARWSRRMHSLGSWEISDVHFSDAILAWAEAEGVIDIQRDGQHEFLGLVEDYEFDEETGVGRVWGVDARGWLTTRAIWPASGVEVDAQSDVASQVIRNYIRNSLSDPTNVDRDVDTNLHPNVQGNDITFFVPDLSLGEVVTFDERYSELLDVTLTAAREGEIWFDVIPGRSNPSLLADRYEVVFHEYVDRTEGEVDQVLFSVQIGTAFEIAVRRSRSGYANAIVALGQGEPPRQTTYLVNEVATGSAYRREAVIDVNDAMTATTLEFVENPTDGQTVTIGSRTYTFVTTLTAADQVLIASNVEDSLYRLSLAIGNAGGAGVLYGAGTTFHADVWATQDSKRLTVSLFGSDSVNVTVALSTTVTGAVWEHSEISYQPLITAAAALLKEGFNRTRSYSVVPNPGQEPYRDSWDLGQLVSVRSDRLGVTDEQLISQVDVTFSEQAGEQIKLVVGEVPLSVIAALKKQAKQN